MLDPNLGWTYLRARWMDVESGRFVSRDPFGGRARIPASLHRFLYAESDPVNRRDPSGLFATRTHQNFTEQVMREMSFSDDAIQKVVDGNVHTDRGSNFWNNAEHATRGIGEPLVSREAAEERSLASIVESLEYSEQMLDQGNEARALFELGIALHTAQDIIAHEYIPMQFHLLPVTFRFFEFFDEFFVPMFEGLTDQEYLTIEFFKKEEGLQATRDLLQGQLESLGSDRANRLKTFTVKKGLSSTPGTNTVAGIAGTVVSIQ